MKKIHKIVMGALLGGLTVLPSSRGYSGTVSASVNTSQYRDVVAPATQNVQLVNSKPSATPEAKPTVTYAAKPTATPEAKPTYAVKPSITPNAKPSGKITATPEPKVSGKITATPEPKSGAKITVTPAPKSGVVVVETAVQNVVTRIFSFFSGWFK